MAEQIRQGLTPSDNRAWVELRSLLDANPDNLRVNPTVSRESLIDQFARRHQYVSYRSVVFPLIFSPVLAKHGCSMEGLLGLRQVILWLGAMVPFLTAMLVYLINDRHRVAKSMAVGILLAGDYQLLDAAGTFLAEIPGLVMLLGGLIIIGSTCRKVSIHGAAAAGLLLAIAALIKLEFIYSVPLSLMVAFLSWRPLTIKKIKYSSAILTVFLLILGGYGLRNHAITGSFFITSKDAVNLWLGNVSGVENTLGFEEQKKALLDEHGFEIGLRKYYKDQLLSHVLEYPLETLRILRDKGRSFVLGANLNRYPWLGDFGYRFGIMINMMALACVPAFIKGYWRLGTSPLSGFVLAFYVISSGLIVAVFIVPRLLVFTHLFALIIACCASIDMMSCLRRRPKALGFALNGSRGRYR